MMRKLNFLTTVEEIEKNEIILPDFQRGFTWKEQSKQKALLASVLTKLPLGTVLLLESDRNEYGCRKIAKKTKLNMKEIPIEKPYVLLDGQQRMTTLVSFLTDIVHYSDLVSPSLARKYFYCIPKFSLTNYDNIFGVSQMYASETINQKGYPDFTTSDIIERIYMIAKKDSKCEVIYEDMNTVNKGEFVSFCTDYEADGYLVPLFLMYGACGNKVREHSKLFTEVLKGISKRYISDIEAAMKNETNDDICNKYIQSVYGDNLKTKKNTTVEDIVGELNERQESWVYGIKGYFDSCISEMEIQEYRLTGNQERLRAIDIYENMNRGGKALDVFDLLLAKAAQNPQFEMTLRDKVEEYVKGNHLDEYKLLFNNCGSSIREEFEKHEYYEYSASLKMKCWDDKENDLTSAYSKLLVDLVGVFHHFMNNDGEITYDKRKIDTFSVICTKREYLLDKVPSKCLWKLIIKACKAIDRSLMFLSVRCGVMTLSDVHYNLMVAIIAFVLANDCWYEDKDKNDVIEAWYWATIFSGNFRIEQNKAFERNLVELTKALSTDENAFVVNIVKNMFSDPKFLTKKIMKVEGEVLPPHFIEDILCQYYLSDTYVDIIKSNRTNEAIRLSVFCNKIQKMHKHHIMPIGELSAKYANIKAEMGSNIPDKSERENKWNSYNSPLNFALVSDKANRIISNASLEQYIQYCDKAAVSDLDIPTEVFQRDKIDKAGSYISMFLDSRYEKFLVNITKRMRKLLKDDNLSIPE